MVKSMATIAELTKKIRDFVKERDWEQFHNPKDMAVSLMLEAGEVLEHFQWKTEEETRKHVEKEKEALADELADVAAYLFELAALLKIDLADAIEKKMAKNAKKYPVEKAKANHRKYTEL